MRCGEESGKGITILLLRIIYNGRVSGTCKDTDHVMAEACREFMEKLPIIKYADILRNIFVLRRMVPV